MAEPVQHSHWVHRGLYVLLALALLFVRMLPIGSPAGNWPGPDVLLCLTMAWVLRRPDYVPAMLIGVVILLEDLILMRPPGLWAALVVVGAEFLRTRAALTRELAFMVEWVLVAAVMVALLLGYRLVFAVAMMPQPAFGFSMVQIVGSILIYPLIVVASRLAFGVRKPATGEVDALGRRL
jgi:rod shape-determining protein MreD